MQRNNGNRHRNCQFLSRTPSSWTPTPRLSNSTRTLLGVPCSDLFVVAGRAPTVANTSEWDALELISTASTLTKMCGTFRRRTADGERSANGMQPVNTGPMPRPRTNPKAHRKNIALTLPPHLIERAEAVRGVAGWSISSMVEKSLTRYLDALDREVGRQCAEHLKKYSQPKQQ